MKGLAGEYKVPSTEAPSVYMREGDAATTVSWSGCSWDIHVDGVFKFSTMSGGDVGPKCASGTCTMTTDATSCADCPAGSYFFPATSTCNTCTDTGEFITPTTVADDAELCTEYIKGLTSPDSMYFAFCPHRPGMTMERVCADMSLCPCSRAAS
jgi:hypothetical protein